MSKEELYFKCRNGEFYTKFTKNEIKQIVDIYDPSTFIFLLKDMDYVWIEKEYQRIFTQWQSGNEWRNPFIRYLTTMRLKAYSCVGYADSLKFNNK